MPVEDLPIDESMLGTRLRKTRNARGLSLKAVERATNGSISAAILGGYERGEHSITAVRLCQLANLYGVPLEDLVEPIRNASSPVEATGRTQRDEIRFDLEQLGHARGREARAVAQLAHVVEVQRNRKSAESIELRRDDLVTAAATLGRSVDSLVESLRRAGVLRRPRGRPPREL